MPTTAELIDICRTRYINAGHREDRNKLSAGISDNETTLPLTFDAGTIVRGSKVSVGLEDMYVWSSQGTSAVVERGQFGSTADDHAQGAIVRINARPSPFEVLGALNDTIVDLSNAGVYQVRTVDIEDASGVAYAYNLPTVGYKSPIDARALIDGADDDWPLLHDWSIADGIPTDAPFTAGRAFRLFEPVQVGTTIRVRYKADLTDGLAALDDDVVGVSGIPAYAVDLLPIGAALKLTAGREIARARDDVQGDTRRAGEVGANHNLMAPRALMAMWDSQLTAVLNRQALEHPVRMKVIR